MRWGLAATVFLCGCVRLGFAPPSPNPRETGPVDAPGLAERGGDAGRDGGPRDGSPADAAPLDGPAPDSPWPGFTLHGFKAYWSSAGTIAWIWQCSGTLPAFDRFEICLDTDPAKVLPGGGTCLGPQDSFALGTADCLGPPWWQMAPTYGLSAQTAYYGKLYVHDKNGAHLGSPMATISTTAVPAAQTVVFTEALLPGVWLTELATSGAKPHSGSVGLVATIPDVQWHNLHYGGMSLAFPGLTDSRLKEGYLELWIDTPAPVQICVTLQQPNDTAEHCPPDYFAAPDGKPGYQRIQIPLSQFVSQSTKQPMTAAQLAATNKLMPGASWGKGTVYIDDIVFRY